MSQPQTVTVDQQEILNRANEVEAPMATPPTDVPQAPCGLTAATNAAEQLAVSADNVRLYLQAGERERQRLATSLRNAAAAYGEVEDESATALDNDGNGEVEAQSAGGAGAGQTDSLEETPKVAAAGNQTSPTSRPRRRSSNPVTRARRWSTSPTGGTTSTWPCNATSSGSGSSRTGRVTPLPPARPRCTSRRSGYSTWPS